MDAQMKKAEMRSATTKPRTRVCVDCGVTFEVHVRANSRCVRCNDCAKKHKRAYQNARMRDLMAEVSGLHGNGKKHTVNPLGPKLRVHDYKQPVSYADIRRRSRALHVADGWRGAPVIGGGANHTNMLMPVNYYGRD